MPFPGSDSTPGVDCLDDMRCGGETFGQASMPSAPADLQ